jgi:cytochrome c
MIRLIALILFAFALSAPALAQLRGHGGPARAVAATRDGVLAVSSAFDGTAIVWGLKTGQALSLVRPHAAPATAVAASPDVSFASGDQSGGLAIWRLGGTPRVLAVHTAAVAAIAATPDGKAFISAGLDGALVRTDIETGVAATIGLRGPPLAGLCAREGDAVVALDRDGGVRWLAGDGTETARLALGAPALTMACDGPVSFVGMADGRVLRVAPEGAPHEALKAAGPVSALAAKGGLLAAATVDGAVRLVERGAPREIVAKRGQPVWGLAFAADELLAAGNDGFVRRYDLATGREREPAAFAEVERVPAALRDHPGARVFEACDVCHSLKPGENRAGPTLAGVIGRRIGTAPGFAYSDALKGMAIVWTEQTIARLFEVGPAGYTPGSKMPEQRVVEAADRAALADFIAKASAPRASQ